MPTLFEPFVFDYHDFVNDVDVELYFVPDVSNEQLEVAEKLWRPAMKQLKQDRLATGVAESILPLDHEHWNWTKKWARVSGSDYFWGVYSEGGQVPEALMMASYQDGHRLCCQIPSQKGLPLVYVDYLEVAPWNLSVLSDVSRFRGLGRFLLEQAVLAGHLLGTEGRVGLHALDQSLSFYRNCSMTELLRERIGLSIGLYTYFEMTPPTARLFVEGR